jgi:hypothetical protein
MLGSGERCVKLPFVILSEPTYTLPDRELTGEEVSALRFRLIAAKIQAQPDLLEIPLRNIDRWLADGHAAVERLEGWRTKILAALESSSGMRSLVNLLHDQGWEAMMWKGFSPFPGVLTKEEVQTLRWNSRH